MFNCIQLVVNKSALNQDWEKNNGIKTDFRTQLDNRTPDIVWLNYYY